MPVVVAFMSQKGGVGKSTLARALAVVAARGKVKVMLGDLDSQQKTLMLWAKARKDHDVAPRITVEAFPGVDAALAHASDADLLILDTGSRVNDETLTLARRVDLVAQPTGPSVDDLHPSILVFQALTQLGIPHERLVFTLSRVLVDEEGVAARQFLSAAGYEVLPGSLQERVAYRQALNRGRGPTETCDVTLNDRADALMQALLEKLGWQVSGAREQARRENQTDRGGRCS
jgi:chromosome partitioning protein